MKPEFTIEADHDLKIIRYRHTGKLSYEDIGEAWMELLSMREFTALKYNLLSDYSKAVFNMELSEANAIVDFLKNVGPVVRGKKQSLIVNDPYSTAGSLLFQEKVFQEVGFIVNTFSTEKAALIWLLEGTNKQNDVDER